MRMIHISHAGPEYRIRCGKWTRFEDHPYCGPIFLDRKGDPLSQQPSSIDAVWSHVNAWYAQGKQVESLGGEKWAKYKTDRHKTLSEVCAARRAANKGGGKP